MLGNVKSEICFGLLIIELPPHEKVMQQAKKNKKSSRSNSDTAWLFLHSKRSVKNVQWKLFLIFAQKHTSGWRFLNAQSCFPLKHKMYRERQESGYLFVQIRISSK